MIDDVRYRWDPDDLNYFQAVADKELVDELFQTPDMTTREQNYFFRMAFMGEQLRRRSGELYEASQIIGRQAKAIKILEAQLENQGDLTKRRGAFIWETLQKLERHYGAATLEEVDGMDLLMEEAPLEIRIKPSAKNPYKLTKDAFKWAIRFAEEAGKKVKREVSTIRKLRCLRYYSNETVPKRPEKRRRLPGEPKKMEAWAVSYTPFFRDLREDSYDPGG